VAAPPVEVSIFDDEDSSGANTGPHPAKQVDGLAEVLQQEPAEHGVVTGGLIPVP